MVFPPEEWRKLFADALVSHTPIKVSFNESEGISMECGLKMHIYGFRETLDFL